MSRHYKLRKIKNKLMLILIGASGLVIVLPLLFIFQYLLKNGYSALNLDFFTELPKPVGETGGGMKNAILGTLYLVGLGGLIGIPWGMGVGVYLSEYGKGKLGTLIRLVVDLLTGVPSIVIGIFVFALIVAPFKGFSALAGGIALALIILPTVARMTEEVMKLIPDDVREAGLALGLTRWRMIVFVLLRGVKSSLLTGVILGMARAAGETAPLLFTAFGSLYLSYNLTEPMASLPVLIYNYAISPFADWHRLAWAGCFVLISIILVLNLVSKIIVHWSEIKAYIYSRRKN